MGNYYKLNKEFRREYKRYYYYNVIKKVYNELFALQWSSGLLKNRKINRDGYWYCLNRVLFKGLRMGQWIPIQNRVIEFMRTGKGKIVGDQVVLDNSDSRRRFREYEDSDEGWRSEKKPVYCPDVVPIKEYFK